MKKLLSVLLAALMIFGSLGMSASALSIGGTSGVDYVMPTKAELETALSQNDFILKFINNDGFTFTADQVLYVSGKGFQTVNDKYKGTFYMLPQNAGDYYFGVDDIRLPRMAGNEEVYQFMGWTDKNGQQYTFAENVKVTMSMADNDGVVTFNPWFVSANTGADTMTMIIGILCKIFGAIYGLLFLGGDTELGVARVQGILGGIL